MLIFWVLWIISAAIGLVFFQTDAIGQLGIIVAAFIGSLTISLIVLSFRNGGDSGSSSSSSSSSNSSSSGGCGGGFGGGGCGSSCGGGCGGG